MANLETSVQNIDELAFEGYRHLIDSISEIVFQTDQQGNWTFLNYSWSRILGYDINECIGKPFFSYLHPDDVVKNYLLFKPLIEGEKSYCSHEIRYMHKSGKPVWIKVFAILSKDADGNTTGTSGTLQDISADRKNRDMIELLSNNISDLVCLHEIDGSYIYVSPSVNSIAGYLPENMIGKNIYDFVHPEDLDKIKQIHADSMLNDNGLVKYIDFRFRVDAGSYVWMEMSTKAITDDDSNFVGLVSSARPIGWRKKAEDQIMRSLQKEQELSRLKSNFVSLASHEIRTPLSGIRSSVELLEMKFLSKGQEDQSVRKYLSNIFSEIDRLGNLIDEVLTVSKIESNSFKCNRVLLDPVKFVNGIILRVCENQKDTREINLAITGAPFEVMADPMLLEHALSNLIQNALKYSPGRPAPVVQISFDSAGDYLISVQDFGIGIPAKSFHKLFGAFHRAPNAMAMPGTGLGLFITKHFIELHKGNIEVDSREGIGTTFTVTLNKS